MYRATFSQLREDGRDYPEAWAIPEDPSRFRNSSSARGMSEEPMDSAALAEKLASFVASITTKHPDAILIESSATITHWETWGLAWFCHSTFPRGRSDAELVRSFSNYVSRHAYYQDRLGSDEVVRGVEYRVCLMGAEDRWRWRGEHDDHDTPICRCEGCTKYGVVRVNH